MKMIRRILSMIFWAYLACAYLLPPFFSLVVIILAWGEWSTSRNGIRIFPPMVEFIGTAVLILFIYCMLGLYVGYIRNRFIQELIYLSIYLFSIYVAFGSGSFFGTGVAVILVFLLIPYYLALLYHLRVMIRELPSRKLLLGKKGIVCGWDQFQSHLEVRIEGKEYRVCPGKTVRSHNFQHNDSVVVAKIKLNDIIVERRNNAELILNKTKNEVNEV